LLPAVISIVRATARSGGVGRAARRGRPGRFAPSFSISGECWSHRRGSSHERDGLRVVAIGRRALVGHRTGPALEGLAGGRVSARDCICTCGGGSAGRRHSRNSQKNGNLVLDPEPIHGKELFEKLSKKYRLALLSNTDSIHVAYMESRYDFFAYFPARVYSCLVGGANRAQSLSRSAAGLAGRRARRSGVISMIIEVLCGRRAATRMTGVHFRSADQLRSDLQGLGLDV